MKSNIALSHKRITWRSISDQLSYLDPLTLSTWVAVIVFSVMLTAFLLWGFPALASIDKQ
jgi:hypothetical protein